MRDDLENIVIKFHEAYQTLVTEHPMWWQVIMTEIQNTPTKEFTPLDLV